MSHNNIPDFMRAIAKDMAKAYMSKNNIKIDHSTRADIYSEINIKLQSKLVTQLEWIVMCEIIKEMSENETFI